MLHHIPFTTFLEHSRVWPGFDERSVRFMTWLLERSGLEEETCLPYVQHYIPPSRDLESSHAEAELVIFSAIDDLLAKTGRCERAQGGSSAPAATGARGGQLRPGRPRARAQASSARPPRVRRSSARPPRARASELRPGAGAGERAPPRHRRGTRLVRGEEEGGAGSLTIWPH